MYIACIRMYRVEKGKDNGNGATLEKNKSETDEAANAMKGTGRTGKRKRRQIQRMGCRRDEDGTSGSQVGRSCAVVGTGSKSPDLLVLSLAAPHLFCSKCPF